MYWHNDTNRNEDNVDKPPIPPEGQCPRPGAMFYPPRWYLPLPPPPPPPPPPPLCEPQNMFSGPQLNVTLSNAAPGYYPVDPPILPNINSRHPPPLPSNLQYLKGPQKRPATENEGPQLNVTLSNAAPGYYPVDPPILPNIDFSRPPPPLPSNFLSKLPQKRPATENEAGPSKMRKMSELAERPCEGCIQWDIRNLCLDASLKKKTAEYEWSKLKLQEKRRDNDRLMAAILKYIELLPPREVNRTEIQNEMQSLLLNHMSEQIPKSSQSQLVNKINEMLRNNGNGLDRSILNTELGLSNAGIVPSTTGILSRTIGIVPSATGLVPSTTPIVPNTTPLVPNTTTIVPNTSGIVPGTNSIDFHITGAGPNNIAHHPKYPPAPHHAQFQPVFRHPEPQYTYSVPGGSNNVLFETGIRPSSSSTSSNSMPSSSHIPNNFNQYDYTPRNPPYH